MKITLKEYLEKLSDGSEPLVYMVAMSEVRVVTGTAPNMWLVTGSGLTQRSWCCHAYTPLFTTFAEAEVEVERGKQFTAKMLEKYNGVRS